MVKDYYLKKQYDSGKSRNLNEGRNFCSKNRPCGKAASGERVSRSSGNLPKRQLACALGLLLLMNTALLQGCGSSGAAMPGTETGTVSGSVGAAAHASVAGSSAVSDAAVRSVEIYNRTGKIQREEFYNGTSADSGPDYTVEYSYNDAGLITSIKKTGSELGSNAPLETWLYSGNNCTQHVLYDENGSTKKALYWTYDKTGQLTKERIVTMLSSATGYGYSGKTEEITEYGEDGLAVLRTCTSPGEWTKDEYGYDSQGRLITDNYYCSSDGESWNFFETTSYFYDESGKLIRETEKEGTGTVFRVRVYEYNDAGSIVSDAVYSSEDLNGDSCLSRTEYEYNGAEQCTSEISYTGNRSVQIYYEYDAQGRCTCISETEYINGTKRGTTVTKTEYDSRSNPTGETVTEANGAVTENFRCEYEYYDDGKIKKKTNFAVPGEASV